MSTLTTNLNFLSPTSWKLTIDNQKYANVAFFSASVTLPAVSITEVTTNFRNQQGFTPGDHITYEPFSVRFMVDENMSNYQEIANWIAANANVAGSPQRHDLILSIMSSKNNLNKQIRFKDAFPTSLSGFEFSAQASDIEYVSAEVSFRYNHFDFIR